MNKREAILWLGNYSGNENQPNVLTLFDNKPFLEYLLEFYQSFGIQHIVLVTNEKNHSAVKYFGNKYQEVKLTWTVSDTSKGTVGAIKAGLLLTENENVLVASASILLGANIGKFYHQHCKGNYPLSVIISPLETMNSKWVVDSTISGRIRNIIPKTFLSKKNMYLSDIYMINRSFLLSTIFDDAVSLENDVLGLYFKTEEYQVMLSHERFVNIDVLQNTPEELSVLKSFNIEHIISEIEENKSQLELVS